MALSIQKTWQVIGVDVFENLGDRANVVRNVKWKLEIKNTDTSSGSRPYAAVMFGVTPIPLPYATANYIDYGSITEADMLNWAFESMGTKKQDFESELEVNFINVIFAHEGSALSVVDMSPSWVSPMAMSTTSHYPSAQQLPFNGHYFEPTIVNLS